MRQLDECSECNEYRPAVGRREFLQVAAAGAAISCIGANGAEDKPVKPDSETLVEQLYKSLTEPQRKSCAFSFDDPGRLDVDNNWHITKLRLAKDFSKDQQALVREIFNGLHSPEYADIVMKQVEHDGGFGNCALAMFGTPGTGKFEFVLTGRHVTRRCDGDSVDGAAFGGPIFYGHAAASFNESPKHEGNVYWYQALRANELFQALDGKQRKIALVETARDEQGTATVAVGGTPKGLPFGELSADQIKLAHDVMRDVLAPFREKDRTESMKLVEAQGFDKLHISYCKQKGLDLGNDGVWDVWTIEGPSMVWYFRGAPHVHTWVNIRASA